jgi:hypothetical protein
VRRRFPRVKRTRPALGVLALALLLTSCASGSLAAPDSSASRTPAATSASATVPATGPTLVVTVPELVQGQATSAAPASASTEAPPTAAGETAAEPPSEDPASPADGPATPVPETPAAAPAATEPAAPAAPAPTGDGLNVSLANCDGCTVLATRRDVAGGRSAALVSTGSGRGILLSVGSDGQVAGVIGVPYGAAFGAPDGGVLPCAQGRCVVQARQSDGRAILSAFELTDTGAWRDVSGDDAFPSATERFAVVDLDGELAIVVQDQGNGAAVWMLYTWGGDRYTVLGCSPDGDPPVSAAAVSPGNCLS